MRETGKEGYQRRVVKKLLETFPGVIVLKNDSEFKPGIPDLTVLFPYGFWATLEVKLWHRSLKEPNQDYYVDLLNDMCFAAFINQDNEEEVFLALQSAYESHREARFSQSQ